MTEDSQDLQDLLGSESFAGSRPPAGVRAVAASVRVGELTLRGVAGRSAQGCCQGSHRVPAGGGFWSGNPHEDLCSYCYEVEREHPHRAPTADEEIRLARHGIERGGMPCFVEAGEDPAATVSRLAELVDAGQLPRIALGQGPRLGDWLESGGILPDGAVVRRDGIAMQHGSMSLEALELQLRGQLCGPPIDPDLLRRLEAAKDERGVIHDPGLADEYHAALIAQEQAARVNRGR